MNLLWDLRLFSYGYAKRGIGRFCTEMIRKFPFNEHDISITIWGDRSKTPDFLNEIDADWISYRGGDWKTDLYKIPWIIQNRHIDLFHYWVALGPIWKIGLGIFHQCRSLLTIYDLGVELWDIPHSSAVKKSRYWSVQKRIASSCSGALCISQSTAKEMEQVLPNFKNKTDVVYMPLNSVKTEPNNKREKYFIALGGSVHKNCYRVIKAFSIFKTLHPEYKLIIIGKIESEEIPDGMDSIICLEPIEKYSYYLSTCSGLIFCSLYEGLGIPPIEALNHCCPLILSNIAPFHETCEDHAYYVDPLDVQSIANGMEIITKDVSYWMRRSSEGRSKYEAKSSLVGEKLLEIYGKILRKESE
jgi:glycosyltransferase involved in cell wall biosynthesis